MNIGLWFEIVHSGLTGKLRRFAAPVHSAHLAGAWGKGRFVWRTVAVPDVVVALERAFGPGRTVGACATWVCRLGGPHAAPTEGDHGLRVWVPLSQRGDGVDVWLMPPEGASEPLPIAMRVEAPSDLEELPGFIRDKAATFRSGER